MTEKVCGTCRWWTDQSETIVEPWWSRSKVCTNRELRATACCAYQGDPGLRIHTLPDFGCNQWQQKD